MSLIFSTNPDKRLLYLIQRLRGKKQYINNRMGGAGIGTGGENPSGGIPDDKKLSVSSTDTTYDFASTKLVAGTGMRLNVLGGAGAQTLEFESLAGAAYTDEQAQDAVGAMVADTDTVDITYTDATPALIADVKKQMSITSDASGLKLSGDATTPGNDYHYGTGTTGTKGWYMAQIPIGGIIMWPLALFDIPTNYALCDGRLAVIPSGSINTPDLRSQFVRGTGLNAAISISGVSTGSDYFQCIGDLTAQFLTNAKFYVTGSTGNDGIWTVASSSYSFPTTTVYAVEDVTNSTADGSMNVAKEPGIPGGANTHSHTAHVVTQSDAHANHTNLTHTTANDANSTGGTAKAVATTHTISAHSAHTGTAVDGHSTENNIPAYIELAYIMRIA